MKIASSNLLQICRSLLAVALFLLCSAGGRAALLIEDPFNYATGNLNGLGSWTSSGSQLDIVVASGNLSVSGLAASTGNKINWSGAGRNSYKPFAGPASGTIYFSFIFRPNATPTAATLIASLNSASTTKRLCIHLGTDNRLGLSHNAGTVTYGGSALVNGTDYLVVGSLEIVTGSANDIYRLWVAPASSTFGGTEPAVSAQTTSTSDTTFTSGRFYFQRDANTPSADADELRVGVSWAEVTPVGVPLTGVKLGFTTQPSNTSLGTTMSPVVVQVQAADSSAVASNNVPVTLTLTSGTGTLGGTLTQNTDASGKATFSNLNIDQPGTKQFTATASGIGVGLTNAVSAAFTITNVGGGGGGNNGNGPVITSIRYLPVGIVLSGTNGAPGSNYNVLATSDFTTNVSTWVPASYANFDANGNFLITNPAASILASQYYRLLTTSNTKLVPPSLTQSPQNLTVAVGQTATFTVGADGPQLSYQWFFGGTAIPGAHNATLVITNAQAGNAGNYFVIVANGAGQAASGTAVLRVGNYAPSITLQPVGETNYTGGTAIFRVAADGTQPLVYQWYKNNNSTPVSGGTNAALALAGLQLTDAGNYFVIVSGPVAPPATSSSAALVVNSAPTALPDTNMVGFAALTGVTGGLGGSNVFVGDYLSLSNYVRHIEPLIIYVTNLIPGPGPTVDQYCYVYGNNKSIIGVGTNAGLSGSDLRINATNIIVQNLYLPVPPGGTNDGITIDGGTKGTGKFVWIDHCTVSNAQDGSIDITKGADYVTISWCKFIYAPKTPSFTHELVNLIGSSDTDFVNNNPFHVTIHHCWYADNAIERMPSVRHGLVHVFNNYYTCSGNNYCVRTRIGSEVFVENNFFSGIQNPWELLTTTGATGLLRATGNNVTGPGDTSYGNTWVNGWYPGQSLIPGTDTLPNLLPIPYDYTNALHSATDAAYYVPNYAGNGKYPYVP